MEPPPASLRKLARRLLAAEAASRIDADPPVHAAARVFEKLRISLTRFAGPDGFASLLRRALALARAEAPALHAVTLRSDGSIEGLEALLGDATNDGPESLVAVISNLLGLLVTFIGGPLTRRLVGEAWPNESLDE